MLFLYYKFFVVHFVTINVGLSRTIFSLSLVLGNPHIDLNCFQYRSGTLDVVNILSVGLVACFTLAAVAGQT